LFKPNFKFDKITDIKSEFLNKNNIKALLLDVDNTLSTHHGEQLGAGVNEWIKKMQTDNIKLLVISNSKDKRVAPFCQKIGLDFISLALKPLPFGFLKALKRLGVKKENVAIVGDQLFTDSLGGNLVGIKTVLLTPILLEDGISFKIRRRIEKEFLKRYKF
jgi:HAD superfamily phosphatase (TIGR01668 family)